MHDQQNIKIFIVYLYTWCTQQAARMRYIVILCLSGCTEISHFMSYTAGFGKILLNVNVGFDFLYKVYLKHFLLYKN